MSDGDRDPDMICGDHGKACNPETETCIDCERDAAKGVPTTGDVIVRIGPGNPEFHSSSECSALDGAMTRSLDIRKAKRLGGDNQPRHPCVRCYPPQEKPISKTTKRLLSERQKRAGEPKGKECPSCHEETVLLVGVGKCPRCTRTDTKDVHVLSCPECDRPCKNKISLGVHRSKAHGVKSTNARRTEQEPTYQEPEFLLNGVRVEDLVLDVRIPAAAVEALNGLTGKIQGLAQAAVDDLVREHLQQQRAALDEAIAALPEAVA